MTPTAGWSEQDYFRASRGARQAWQRTNSQLQLGLDEGHVARADADGCGVSLVEPARSHPLPGAGSTESYGPDRGPSQDKRDQGQRR